MNTPCIQSIAFLIPEDNVDSCAPQHDLNQIIANTLGGIVKIRTNLLFLMLVSLLLAACAGNVREHNARELAIYKASAGPQTGSFTVGNGLYSWRPLGDHTVAVYTQPDRAYLLDLALCPELPHASGISVTSAAGRVNSNVDKVIISGSNTACLIQHISPVNLDELKHTQKSSMPMSAPGDGDSDSD